MKKSHLFIGMFALDLAILDQVTKWLAVSYLQTPIQLIPGLSLKYAENAGVAFSLPVPPAVLIPLSFLLLAGIVLYGFRHLDFSHPLSIVVMALILGGAVGNLLDRVFRGFVVDFIALSWWPTFNLADAYLTAGIFLLLVFYGKINRV